MAKKAATPQTPKRFGLVVDGVLVQVQPNEQEGFIAIPDGVCCGFLFDGTDWSHPGVQVTLDMVREKRNALLQASDWAVLPDSPLQESKIEEWKEYRQKLRDITSKDINNIVWPTAP